MAKEQQTTIAKYSVFFTIAAIYMSGTATLISENDNGIFAGSARYWFGYGSITFATVVLVVTLYNRLKQQSR